MINRVTLFGLFGGTNLGNNATFDAMVARIQLKFPQVKIDCITPKGTSWSDSNLVHFLPMDPMPISKFLWRISNQQIRDFVWRIVQLLTEPLRVTKAKKALLGSDVLLIVGTGVIDEWGQTSLNLPLDLYRWTSVARKLNVQIHFVSVGAELIVTPLARWFFRKSLQFAKTITVRDEFSRGQLRELGINVLESNIFPDLVFGHHNTCSTKTLVEGSAPQSIALGVMGYYGWNVESSHGEKIYSTYITKLGRLVSELLDYGHTVYLVIGDTRADQKTVEDIAKNFEGDWRSDKLHASNITTVNELFSLIAKSDFVIASRFHNLVIGLICARKVISISYSKKNDAVLESFGLEKFCHPIESFEPEEIIEHFHELTQIDSKAYTSEMRSRVSQFRTRLDEMYEHLFAEGFR